MNLIEVQNALKGLPDQNLQQEMQQPQGNYPPFLVLTEINRRKTMRSEHQARMAGQAQPPLSETLPAAMAPSLPPGGAAGQGGGGNGMLPTKVGGAPGPDYANPPTANPRNISAPRAYASGGIVGFAGGGGTGVGVPRGFMRNQYGQVVPAPPDLRRPIRFAAPQGARNDYQLGPAPLSDEDVRALRETVPYEAPDYTGVGFGHNEEALPGVWRGTMGTGTTVRPPTSPRGSMTPIPAQSNRYQSKFPYTVRDPLDRMPGIDASQAYVREGRSAAGPTGAGSQMPPAATPRDQFAHVVPWARQKASKDYEKGIAALRKNKKPERSAGWMSPEAAKRKLATLKAFHKRHGGTPPPGVMARLEAFAAGRKLTDPTPHDKSVAALEGAERARIEQAVRNVEGPMRKEFLAKTEAEMMAGLNPNEKALLGQNIFGGPLQKPETAGERARKIAVSAAAKKRNVSTSGGITGGGGGGGGGFLEKYDALNKVTAGEKDLLAPIQAKIEAMEARARERKGTAGGMAMMRAGLGMMASRSPFPFVGIGEGGEKGLQQYQESMKDIRGDEMTALKLHSAVASARMAERQGNKGLAMQWHKVAEGLRGQVIRANAARSGGGGFLQKLALKMMTDPEAYKVDSIAKAKVYLAKNGHKPSDANARVIIEAAKAHSFRLAAGHAQKLGLLSPN